MSGLAPTSQAAADGSTGADAGSVIVVGYSAKPEGRAALRRSIEEAKLRGSRLIVVHTSPEAEVAELTSELASSGVGYEVATPVNDLDPAEELIAAAERTSAEFIVIGLRRRSPVGKLLLGSNAQRVLLDASCPVLAVKADES
jgi:nucleotide-binding universal stress UspA family protein